MPYVKLKGTRQGTLRRCVRDKDGNITHTYEFPRNEPVFIEPDHVYVIKDDLYVSILPLSLDPSTGRFKVLTDVTGFSDAVAESAVESPSAETSDSTTVAVVEVPPVQANPVPASPPPLSELLAKNPEQAKPETGDKPAKKK